MTIVYIECVVYGWNEYFPKSARNQFYSLNTRKSCVWWAWFMLTLFVLRFAKEFCRCKYPFHLRKSEKFFFKKFSDFRFDFFSCDLTLFFCFLLHRSYHLSSIFANFVAFQTSAFDSYPSFSVTHTRTHTLCSFSSSSLIE